MEYKSNQEYSTRNVAFTTRDSLIRRLTPPYFRVRICIQLPLVSDGPNNHETMRSRTPFLFLAEVPLPDVVGGLVRPTQSLTQNPKLSMLPISRRNVATGVLLR